MIAMKKISCRAGCGACCIAPSLSSAIPGMDNGKPAGIRCVQLTENNRCRMYGKPGRPPVCLSYQATEEFCGATQEDALRALSELERITATDRP
jgi:Fe-S-cluster containining protein